MNLLLALVLLLTPASPTAVAPLPEVRAAAVLHDWDARRAAAWAAGDPDALRELYTRDSSAGRADVAMLHAWQARGLRAAGVRMQLLAVRVRAWGAGRLVVEVVDRVASARVVPTGEALPTDRPTAHTIVLRQVAGEWRVAAVSAR